MIIMYKNTTGRIFQAHYVAEENIWTQEQCDEWTTNNPGTTARVVDDRKDASACYWNGTELALATEFSITISTQTITDNGTDYVQFSNLPNETRVYVDDVYIGDTDSSGIFQFTSSEVGTYWVRFEKYGYFEHSTEVTVNASI